MTIPESVFKTLNEKLQQLEFNITLIKGSIERTNDFLKEAKERLDKQNIEWQQLKEFVQTLIKLNEVKEDGRESNNP